MDALDSRHLTPQDGFAHPFAREGAFSYSVCVGGFRSGAPTGAITVSGAPAAPGKGEQYDIVLRSDAECRRFVPCEANASTVLHPNDFVMFQFESAVLGQPSCSILVESEGAVECDSRLLKTHDVFIHYFLQPGEYTYKLSDSSYILSVADHRAMTEDEHNAQIRRPLIVHVKGADVDIADGSLVVGQSAIWAIDESDGVCIELVAGARGVG